MRNTLIREALIFTIMMIAVFFASNTLLNRAGVNVVEVLSSIFGGDVEKNQSIVWFVNHPADTRQWLEKCHNDRALSNSKNCLNAGLAEQISRQTHANSYSAK